MVAAALSGLSWSHEDMRKARRTVEHLIRTLERAPGADLLEPEDWRALHRNLTQIRDEIDSVLAVTGRYPAPPDIYAKEG